MPEGAVLLMEDETILRLFPVLRLAWSLRGEQAPGLHHGPEHQAGALCHLQLTHWSPRLLARSGYEAGELSGTAAWKCAVATRKRPVWMLLDEAKCHIAEKSQALASALDIHFVWLPKQCSELNSRGSTLERVEGQGLSQLSVCEH